MPVFGFLKKRDYSALLAPSGHTLLIKGGDKLLNAALAAGLAWPHDCRVGSCGTCRCILKSGTVKRLTDFSYTLASDEIERGTILACQSQLRSDITVEIDLGTGTSATLERHAGRIARITALTHDIQHIEVALNEDAFASARAGQYAEIALPGLAQPRSYSFARAPAAADGLVSFFIRHVPGGAFTDWLFGEDRTGAALELSGPYGSFYYRPAVGRMICIAGGSGLAPIYALLDEAARAGVARDCVVLFGARTRADLYYLDALAALGRAWDADFEVRPVLSMEPDGSGWTGARGLVTEALQVVAGPGFTTEDQGYLCGPPPMVDAGVARLRALGMAESAIHCDRFLDASTQPGGREAIAV